MTGISLVACFATGLIFYTLFSGKKGAIGLQTYIDELCAAGLSKGDATVIVDDFLREYDEAGLKSYIRELRLLRRKYVALF